MQIIDLADARIARTPHIYGQARCISCKHEWTAIAPVGTLLLECPSCSLIKGEFIDEIDELLGD